MQEQLATLELLINQALKLDEKAQTQLAQFLGKSIRITCSEPDLDIVLSVLEKKIRLLTYDSWLVEAETTPTTHLTGGFAAFVQLLAAEDKAAALINLDLKLKGDTALLIDLQNVLTHIGIDWEYHLARFVGDVPAHFLGKMSRSTWRWIKDTQPIFVRHVREFVTEEMTLTPPKVEIDAYVDDIQQLSQRIERLEAHVKRFAIKRKS